MKNIITIQHTQSMQHTNAMIGSWEDWELTELGIIQAKKMGRRLAEEIKPDKYVIYSSDLLRAKETADIISSFLDIEPIYIKGLREFNLGVAIGKSKKWARDNNSCSVWPHTIDWGEKIDDKPFSGCESKRDVWIRLTEFFNKIMSNEEENIIIVSHDGTLSIFFAMWLGLEIEALNRCNISGRKGGVSFLREDEKGNRIISRLNDLSYII